MTGTRRRSRPVQLLKDNGYSQQEFVSLTGRNHTAVSLTFSGRYPWPKWMRSALSEYVGNDELVEEIFQAHLDERSAWLTDELVRVVNEKVVS